MARDPVVLAAADIRIIHNPWPALTTGLVLAAASALWFLITKHAAPALAFLGLLASGAAITIRPRSSLILGLAGLSGIFAWLGLQRDLSVGGTDWDSGRALVAVLTGLAFLAGVLALVPRVVRRVAISLLVIFHFGGILTAVTNIPPNPWMSNMAWTHVYRPYLEFFYLGNAYHFYSPDPGPGTQLWFYAQFEDGKIQDYIVADRNEAPLNQEYDRLISIAESANQKTNVSFTELLYQRRGAAGEIDGINSHPELALNLQYREPTGWYSKRMLESYARFVARNVKHPTGAAKKVTGVKVYLAVHHILTPQEVAAKVDPESRWLFLPFFMGEFDPDGDLMDPKDPYLYWLIPILKEPVPVIQAPQHRPFGGPAKHRDVSVADFLEIHRHLKTGRFKTAVDAIPDGKK